MPNTEANCWIVLSKRKVIFLHSVSNEYHPQLECEVCWSKNFPWKGGSFFYVGIQFVQSQSTLKNLFQIKTPKNEVIGGWGSRKRACLLEIETVTEAHQLTATEHNNRVIYLGDFKILIRVLIKTEWSI